MILNIQVLITYRMTCFFNNRQKLHKMSLNIFMFQRQKINNCKNSSKKLDLIQWNAT